MLKQLNLNKCKVAMQNLRHMLSNESPSIYCIQEPYCTNLGFPANVPKNYNAFGVTNSRAIILAHVSIDLIFSNEFSTEDITVCFMNSSKRYIASIYLDILKDPIHPLMIKMAEYFAKSKKMLSGAWIVMHIRWLFGILLIQIIGAKYSNFSSCHTVHMY